MAEESLRLTAAEGSDEKGYEVCAMGGGCRGDLSNDNGIYRQSGFVF
jgi:hypothetical protein